MIGNAPSNRSRRICIAVGVVLLHGLLLWLAMVARMDRSEDQPVENLLVTMTIGMPGEQHDSLDARAEKPAAVRLQSPVPVQAPVPQIQGIVVELAEVKVPTEEPPIPADTAASAYAAPDAEAGLAGDASDAGGRAGGGEGLVLLQKVIPIYPAASVRRGEQGVTLVVIHVMQNGRVDQVRVVRGSGSKDLDRAAVDAFRKWRFAALPPGTASQGKWVQTMQRFILYQFKYSRLDPGAADHAMEEYLKPRSDMADSETAGGREALLAFISQVRDQTIKAPDRATQQGLAGMRTILERWGAVKSVSFTGLAGNGRWMTHGIQPGEPGGSTGTVDVSWNMFEVRHESAVSAWLVAVGRDGQVWDARFSMAPWR